MVQIREILGKFSLSDPHDSVLWSKNLYLHHFLTKDASVTDNAYHFQMFFKPYK